ncbi:MAG: L-serine ammonia-lyase, iron-sulfur-dependent, subunit alpha [Lachnospiraceae bacterium]
MSYRSLTSIIALAQEKNLSFWEAVAQEDMNERMVSLEDSLNKMLSLYLAMKHADAAYDANLRSQSCMVGGQGQKIHEYYASQNTLCGPFIGTVVERAIKMGESNACMKRIVAAPTAGSCGVVPAVLLSIQEREQKLDLDMAKAMFVAAGVGEVIANRAFIAGAAGGCQAEIGSASAMAAAAAAFLMGGNNDAIIHAAALALKNLLGLACDPVAGLVEVPCVKRNVIGAVNAMTSADLALAGIRSQIPPDEVIDAMRSIGASLPASIRETGEGGLAATPTASKITQNLKEKMRF